MPDGKFSFYESHSPRIQAAIWRGEQETIAELIEAGKKRALGLMDDLEDALEEIERERPGSMKWARNHLADARTEVEGTR